MNLNALKNTKELGYALKTGQLITRRADFSPPLLKKRTEVSPNTASLPSHHQV